ncbi:MAG: transcription termination/antitermination protein NusG [Deltaproteobacteria bacterium]|jgi:transcriptional antiterminator NusG|nr:transcription termination/antitermination protein NusG [Deltaproteobacteria bacterium]
MALQWYVVHTFTAFENKVKLALEERVQKMGLQEQITDVVLPMENVMEMGKSGTRRTASRKLFPGYILVRMELNDVTWHAVKETPKVSGFLGDKNNPMPISDEEASRVLVQMEEGAKKPKPKFNFEEGDEIKVVEGPFNSFTGVVEEVHEDKGKLKVLISIFGRPTPVELDFVQVDKLS